MNDMIDHETLVNAAGDMGYTAGRTGRAAHENPFPATTQGDQRDAWDAQWEQGAQVRAEVAAGA